MRARQMSVLQWPSWPWVQQPIAGLGRWPLVLLVGLTALVVVGAFTAVRPMLAAIIIAGPNRLSRPLTLLLA